MSRIFVSGALYLVIISSAAGAQSCGEDKVRKCISIAEPMLKDPHLIFPDNMNDINNVCRTWSNFVDCIRRYIDKCFSKVRKDQFNTAVEPPIASVHQMCSVSTYQAEYLKYAGCIKSTVIEPEHCGGHYSVLVSEVSQENVRKPNLCCAYHNFRTCVIQKTRLRCDNNQAEGIAAKFSRQVLDKAFRFLQDQCLNYIPDTSKCNSMLGGKASTMSISRLGEGRSVSLESTPASVPRKSPYGSADVYHRPGKPAGDAYNSVGSNTAQSTLLYEAAARIPNQETSRASMNSQQQQQQQHQMPVTSVTQVRQSSKTAKVNDELFRPEEGTSRKTEATYYTAPIVENSAPISPVTSRPSSYGRGVSWSTTTTTTTTTSTSEIPDWATNTWLTHSQDFTTEEIYPAAGSFGGNNIDEPNQQGLSRNGGARLVATAAAAVAQRVLYIIIFCAFAILLK